MIKIRQIVIKIFQKWFKITQSRGSIEKLSKNNFKKYKIC